MAMSFIQYGLASAVVTFGIVVGIVTMLYVKPLIKNKVATGLVFCVVAFGIGLASSLVVMLLLNP